ncbi:MAG: GNAT family N-acetyltransferase [Planctomycetes bacterium]|nr:GNAT family N-acetyltransferase [Planctomycetota bacterium]
MDAIPIRAARRGDVPSLLLLWAAMVEENARLDPRLAVHPDAKEHMARTLAGWVDDPHRVVLVAEEHGRLVVGFAAGQVLAGNGLQAPARLGEVTDCYVVPARRRRGAGRRLAARLLDLLAEKGAEAVRLQVVAKNAAAQAFWTSAGWEPLEEVLEKPVAKGAPPAATSRP